ncbi:MAG: radical SAM protein [Clostridiales bacterium]|nr:radical SAM protein [Clostridiales bacterium]
MNLLENCTLCPKRCGVNRIKGEKGFCGSGAQLKIARAALHFWEEPCISGTNGSGAVFFSYCTLKCVYCQNYGISTQNRGRFISDAQLADIFLDLQAQGAHNINLVTPTHFVPQIISAVDTARKHGLNLPIIYNTSGYENTETIDMLDGYIDVYLPDLKYFDNRYAVKYSGAKDYYKIAQGALERMYSQVGPCRFGEDGIIKKGMIVRHLMLPGLLFDTKKIIDRLYARYGDDIFISIMSQYTPLPSLPQEFPELNRRIKPKYYDAILDYAAGLGITNAYIQDFDSADESFIPEFFGK